MNQLETPHYFLLAIVVLLGIFLPKLEPFLKRRMNLRYKKVFLRFKDSEAFAKFLEEKSSYYANLDEVNKAEFRFRVDATIKSWKFYGMEGLQLREEHKWIIGMAAVQLNFGLSEFKLPVVKKVAVYPEIFRGLRGGLYEFIFNEQANTLEISIKAFENGFDSAIDGKNAGLHAMSSVMASLVKNHLNNDRVFEYFLPQALESIFNDYHNANATEQSFFSEELIINEYEFLALAIEKFFEKSALMKVQFPGIYQNLCLLHQQDPLNQRTNYQLDADFKLKANINKSTPPYPIGFNFISKGSNYSTSVILGTLIMIGLLPLAILATHCSEAFGLILVLNFIGGMLYALLINWSRFLFIGAIDLGALMIAFMEGCSITALLIFTQHFALPPQEIEVHVELNSNNCTPECILEREDIPSVYRELGIYKVSFYTIKEKLKQGKTAYFDLNLKLDLLGIRVKSDTYLYYSDNPSK